MRALLLLLPFLAYAAPATLLTQAEAKAALYRGTTAKAPPPSPFPLPETCLANASIWFSVDLEMLAATEGSSPLQLFTSESVWQTLVEIGVEGVAFDHLRGAQTLGPDPKWGNAWPQVRQMAERRGMALIGNLIGNTLPPGPDFGFALQNVGDYPNLYHLIEIASKDWKLLPKLGPGQFEANIPWLSLQELCKLGYVPEDFTPYVKESAWNASAPIEGVDGKVRRWIYLKEGKNNPVLSWLSPSFTAYRLATGDALEGMYQLGQTIFHVDGKIPPMAQEMLALWVRKIGGTTAASSSPFFEDLTTAKTDMVYETATRPALLHALLTQDTEALRMTYRLYLDLGVTANRLVHALFPFDEYVCDWVSLMNSPKQKFQYWEERITGEVLRKRLLKEDLIRLECAQTIPQTTWVDYCARSLGVKDFENHKEELTRAHLLLAFTYAMQPGAFSFSAADLLGALPDQTQALELMGPNNNTLYASLPIQMTNPRSFACQLKAILTARKEVNIENGELISVLPSPHAGTLLLLYRLPTTRYLYLLAINFARTAVAETFELSDLANTWAIDVFTRLAEEKFFSSGKFSFILPPMAGRAFYFQPKYYD